MVRAIRATPDLSEMIVVLLSSQIGDEDVWAGFTAGADRYLTKPFSPMQLLTLVVEGLGT